MGIKCMKAGEIECYVEECADMREFVSQMVVRGKLGKRPVIVPARAAAALWHSIMCQTQETRAHNAALATFDLDTLQYPMTITQRCRSINCTMACPSNVS